MKLHLVHIHHDVKFLLDINKYQGDYFEHTLIIIGEKKKINGDFPKAHFFWATRKNLLKIVTICKKADLIVLNDLSIFNSKIALALPKEVKIAWRFFGHELYGKKKPLFLSEKTKELGSPSIANYARLVKKKITLLLTRMFVGLIYKKNEFNDSVKRIDFFLGLFEDEYLFLKKSWPGLPQFIKLPLSLKKVDFTSCKSKKQPIIIIGNSRNNFNNHPEMLDIIESSASKKDIAFSLLFNYGVKGPYSKQILKRAKKIPNVDIVKDFMNPETFERFYKNASALVLNAYRQMAIGNILAAFRNGVKVYLNEKNITMQWLIREGFFVFPITSLANDIEKDNFKLTPAEIEHNIAQLAKLMNSYTKEDFQNELYERVKNEKPKRLLQAE